MIHSAPSAGGYAAQRTAALGQVLRAIAVPELELAITDLMLTSIDTPDLTYWRRLATSSVSNVGLSSPDIAWL
jgi:hypothetical protein